MPDPSATVVAEPRNSRQRRGDELRLHILLSAKDVFLDAGYERASMDAVALKASTSKRSLYAHFESKDVLFGAVLEVIRGLFLSKLGTPEDYAPESADAVTLFCARFLQLMTWEAQVRTCRLCVAEADRAPEIATTYFDAMFTTTARRLASFLRARYGFDFERADAVALDLLGRTALPRIMRTLLRVDPPIAGHDSPRPDAISSDVDIQIVRSVVESALPN
ncbi:TetR/AcrR family transcriptional regulator [Humibacter antri]